MENKKKILVTDDEFAIANALSLKLSKLGFDVKIANDGEEAFNLIKSENFDIVLMDLMMDKKDGFSVLEDMRKENIGTPVIITSNLGQDEDKERAEKLGAVGYFVKSNTPISEIVEKVEKILQVI
jgi:DNA-binding response OmpR family regulator